jgi:hypothetical protein
LEKETAAKVLSYFYPSTENNDIRTNRIDKQSLRATALSIRNGVVHARLDGSLKMKHPFDALSESDSTRDVLKDEAYFYRLLAENVAVKSQLAESMSRPTKERKRGGK